MGKKKGSQLGMRQKWQCPRCRRILKPHGLQRYESGPTCPWCRARHGLVIPLFLLPHERGRPKREDDGLRPARVHHLYLPRNVTKGG